MWSKGNEIWITWAYLDMRSSEMHISCHETEQFNAEILMNPNTPVFWTSLSQVKAWINYSLHPWRTKYGVYLNPGESFIALETFITAIMGKQDPLGLYPKA